MLPDRVSNPGPLTYESGALPIALRGPAMFSLESPHRGDSNEYTQYTIFNMKIKIILNYPKSAAMVFFPSDLRTSSKQPW